MPKRSSFRDRYKKQKEDLLKRHEESVADRGEERFGSIIDKTKLPKGVNFWKCKEGKHVIDFIPFLAGPNMPKVSGGGVEEGAFTWLVDLWLHRNVGVLEHPYVCPAYTNGEPCPICEYLKQNRDKMSDDEYYDIKAKHRTIYLIWCHDSVEEKEKGIQIWDVAHWFMEDKLKEIAENPKGGGTVLYFDPDVGKNVTFTRRGSGASNTQFLAHNFYDREEPIPDEILDQSFPLDSVIKYSDYDEIYNAFYGSSSGPSTEDVVDEAPFDVEDQEAEEEYEDNTSEDEIAPDECPAGGEFGVDFDQLEDCDNDCPNWDDCYAANQELQGEEEPESEPEPEPEPEKPARKKSGLRSSTTNEEPKRKPKPIRHKR